MRKVRWAGRLLATAGIVFTLTACGGAGGSGSGSGARTLPVANLRPRASGKVQHVVIIVQENRSFDNLFHDFPGADTQDYGYTSTGQKEKLQPVGLATEWDIDHSSFAYLAACDGTGSVPGTDCKMDGFDKETPTCGHIGPPCPHPNPQYSYVPKSDIEPYFTMAKEYVLADRMFASNFDGSSFISHQYIIAGQASSAVNYPTYLWGCGGGKTDKVQTLTLQRELSSKWISACFDNQTLGDELDAAGLTWSYYAASLKGNGGPWSAYQAIKHIRYGPDWKAHVISPQTRFFKDITRGDLPAVSWITPSCANSDHAGCGSSTGPAWVASLVNAVGQSKYWDSTAIFVFWDDYGGWYDHVSPPLEDYDGLGIRVPLLIISPYAKRHFVSHVQYEHGSILRFVEDQFGLGQLSATDARANSPEADAFDFTKPPRRFVAIPSALKQSYFLAQPPDNRPPDKQ